MLQQDEGSQGEGQVFYPLAQMAMLIALRVRPPGEDGRATIDKIRKRLRYAVKIGEVHPMLSESGLFYVPEVIAWAQRKWPDKLCDLVGEHAASAHSNLLVHDKVQHTSIPADLPSCQDALEDAQQLIHKLRADIASAHAEIARLRPLADKYEQNREKNRQSAKLPRKSSL